jgi:hypothetical protein
VDVSVIPNASSAVIFSSLQVRGARALPQPSSVIAYRAAAVVTGAERAAVLHWARQANASTTLAAVGLDLVLVHV